MIDMGKKIINRDMIIMTDTGRTIINQARTITTDNGETTMIGNGGNIHGNGVTMIANGGNMKVIDIGEKFMHANGMIGISGTMIMGITDLVNFY